jgi:hypothetical protein
MVRILYLYRQGATDFLCVALPPCRARLGVTCWEFVVAGPGDPEQYLTIPRYRVEKTNMPKPVKED